MKTNFYWKVTNGERSFLVYETETDRYPKLRDALENLPFEEFEDFSKLKNTNLHKFFIELNETEMDIMDDDGNIGK